MTSPLHTLCFPSSCLQLVEIKKYEMLTKKKDDMRKKKFIYAALALHILGGRPRQKKARHGGYVICR